MRVVHNLGQQKVKVAEDKQGEEVVGDGVREMIRWENQIRWSFARLRCQNWILFPILWEATKGLNFAFYIGSTAKW